MTLIQLIFIVLASLAGIAAAWFLRNKTHSELLSILLSFSGAYLLGNVVLHLLPEIFAESATVTRLNITTIIPQQFIF